MELLGSNFLLTTNSAPKTLYLFISHRGCMKFHIHFFYHVPGLSSQIVRFKEVQYALIVLILIYCTIVYFELSAQIVILEIFCYAVTHKWLYDLYSDFLLIKTSWIMLLELYRHPTISRTMKWNIEKMRKSCFFQWMYMRPSLQIYKRGQLKRGLILCLKTHEIYLELKIEPATKSPVIALPKMDI